MQHFSTFGLSIRFIGMPRCEQTAPNGHRRRYDVQEHPPLFRAQMSIGENKREASSRWRDKISRLRCCRLNLFEGFLEQALVRAAQGNRFLGGGEGILPAAL